MAKRKQSKIVNKKHLARLQKEKNQIRTITYTTIIVIAAVIVLVMFGVFGQTILQARQPVAEVNGVSISTKSFQAHVRLLRQQMINQYIQYYQFAQMLGVDPTSNSTIASTLQQIQSELADTTTLGENVLNQMIDNILIKQEAEKMDITVSSVDLEKSIQEALGYTPNGTLTPTITPTSVIYPTLNPTQLALYPPSATPTVMETSISTPTSTTEPTSQTDITATPTSVPTDAPTATPYTFDGYQSQYQQMLISYDSFGLTEADVRSLFEDSLIKDKIYPIITADVPHTAEMVWARHILVADEATALKVRDGLLRNISWDSLALEYSTDTGSSSKGGDLGWFQRGAMVTEFEDAAFSLEIGEISQPIQTTYGYHIIQVLGHEDRPLTADEYKTKTDKVFSDWVASLRDSADLTVHDYYKDRIPANPTLQDALNQ